MLDAGPLAVGAAAASAVSMSGVVGQWGREALSDVVVVKWALCHEPVGHRLAGFARACSVDKHMRSHSTTTPFPGLHARTLTHTL